MEEKHGFFFKYGMLHHINHEMRTPLTSIIGYTDVLIASKNIAGREKDYIHVIKRQAIHLLDIIENMLDATTMEIKKIEIDNTPFGVTDCILRSIETVTPLAEEKSLEIITEINETIPKTLKGDHIRLKQVLINILGNAIKFTNKGYIKITANWEYEDEKCIILIDIEDTGVGIPTDDLDLIFEPFYQVNTSISKSKDEYGMGLGLPIVKEVISALGGTIEVDSKIKKGSIFHLRIPFDK